MHFNCSACEMTKCWHFFRFDILSFQTVSVENPPENKSEANIMETRLHFREVDTLFPFIRQIRTAILCVWYVVAKAVCFQVFA